MSKISSYWCRDVAVPVFIMLTVFPNIMSIELFRLYWYHMHFVVRKGWTWCIVPYAKLFGCYRKYREIIKKKKKLSKSLMTRTKRNICGIINISFVQIVYVGIPRISGAVFKGKTFSERILWILWIYWWLKMLEFYPNPLLTHQGLLQGHHHDSITTSMSCNGHGRTGMQSCWCKLINTFIN